MSRFRKIAGTTAALLAGMTCITAAGSASAQTAGAVVVGNTDIAGAVASYAGAGYKAGSVFQAAETGTYTTWEAYAVGGNQAETYTPAVYATANGQATSLLATGTPVVIAAHQAAGWVTSSIKVNLNAGSSYWIGFLPGAASAEAGIYYDPAAAAGQWNKNSNISTPDSWFSPVNSSDQRWDVALTMPGSPATPPTTAPPTTAPPTTTAPSGPVSVGVTAVGSTSSQAGAGFVWGDVVDSGSSGAGVVSAFRAYVRGGSQAQVLTPVIYGVGGGGAPSGLLAKGSPVTVAAGQAAGWVSSPISVTFAPNTEYFLGLLSGGASAEAYEYASASGVSGYWAANAGGWSNPDQTFGTAHASSQSWSFNVVVSPSGSTSGASQSSGSASGTANVLPSPTTTTTTPPTTTTTAPTTAPPTTTAPSGPVSVGVTAVGSTSSQAGAGFVWGDVVDSGSSGAGVVSAFRAYVRGGSQAQVLTPVIYGVGGGGAPSGLLAKGSPVTVAAGQAAGWVSSPISVTFAPNTEYFLGLLSGGASAEAYEYASASGVSGYWAANAGGWSNPDQTFGTAHASSQSWSFNVVVSPSGSTSGASQSSGSASGTANVLPSPTTTTTTPPTTTTTAPPTTTTTAPPSTTGSCSSVQYSLNWCGWSQKVSDTFANDGGQLNPNLWWAPYDCSTVGCGNDGVGVRSASLLNVSNGALNIGSETLASPKVGAGTMMGRNWLYGKFEVTASVDAGSGTGPAILLMTTGTWPQGGELDLMESPAGARSYFTVTDHYGANNSSSGTGVACNCTGKNTWDLIWEPGQVTEYFNGTEVWSTTNPAMIPTGTMNLAVQMDPGPNGFIAGVDSTTKPLEDLHVYSTAVWQ